MTMFRCHSWKPGHSSSTKALEANMESWNSVRGHLERVMDNAARLFSDAELDHLAVIVHTDDKEYAATLASHFFSHSPLRGELLDIYTHRVGDLIGVPLKIKVEQHNPVDDRTAWSTNPEAKTFEIGW